MIFVSIVFFYIQAISRDPLSPSYITWPLLLPRSYIAYQLFPSSCRKWLADTGGIKTYDVLRYPQSDLYIHLVTGGSNDYWKLTRKDTEYIIEFRNYATCSGFLAYIVLFSVMELPYISSFFISKKNYANVIILIIKLIINYKYTRIYIFLVSDSIYLYI